MAMVRLNADVDDNLVKRLRHVLVDEGLTFSEWLRRQIDAYLFEKLDLFRWWDPAELAQAVGPTSRPDDGRIIAEYRYQKHLEAWIASHFTSGYSRLRGVKTEVRMVPDRDFDYRGGAPCQSRNMAFAAFRKSVRLTPSECRNAAASRTSFSTPVSFM